MSNDDRCLSVATTHAGRWTCQRPKGHEGDHQQGSAHWSSPSPGSDEWVEGKTDVSHDAETAPCLSVSSGNGLLSSVQHACALPAGHEGMHQQDSTGLPEGHTPLQWADTLDDRCFDLERPGVISGGVCQLRDGHEGDHLDNTQPPTRWPQSSSAETAGCKAKDGSEPHNILGCRLPAGHVGMHEHGALHWGGCPAWLGSLECKRMEDHEGQHVNGTRMWMSTAEDRCMARSNTDDPPLVCQRPTGHEGMHQEGALYWGDVTVVPTEPEEEEVMPHPVTVEVCSECEQPWEEHLRLASYSTYDENERYLGERTGKVTLEHCVRLLRVANQGPPGPVGPMGATGAAGARGRDFDEGLP